MIELNEHELIYDWNLQGRVTQYPKGVELNDETLRDGLQSPSVTQPRLEEKIQLLHLMSDLGIHSADIGYPGASAKALNDVVALAKEIVEHKLKIVPNCAGRTVKVDIDPIVEASERAGIAIEAATFLGSSPIRQYAEGWDLDRLLKLTADAVSYVVSRGLPSMFVTEDTTRADPETLRKLYTCAIEHGARRICLADTVGHATPDGVYNLITFIKEVVKATGEDVKIDWHGHRDRGLAVPNTLAAIAAGAHRVHGTALGIGERAGNTPMDILVVNLKLLGVIDNDLSRLPEYCRLVSVACGVPIPFNYPVVGADAFRTGTGVHAAAVIKAQRKGHDWLADLVYSGVPAGMFGFKQGIEVGPMSGEANVIYWLSSRGIEPSRELVTKVFDAAKRSNRLLTDAEIEAIVAAEHVVA